MHWIALQPDAAQVLGSQLPGSAGGNEALDAAAIAVADPLTALAWQALQFTPKVARVALNEGEEALLMEISASERLFGGRQPLLRQIYKKNKAVGHVNYAQAATSLIALAKLQMGGGGQIGVRARSTEFAAGAPLSGNRDPAPICPPPPISPLPLHTLAAARPHLATLARIGCNTWGDVRALPRGGVVRRFGAELLDALDRAYGLKPEIYPWLTLPETFAAKIELHAHVETAPALMFGAQRLFKQLQLWLQLRNEGVAALEFGWTMDARRNTARNGGCEGALTLRTAEATQDIAHLQRLLGENLARLTLPAPVLYVSLRTLETEPLALQSASLLLEDAQKGDSLHQMVERLTARLGPENVVQLQTRADHRPEIRQQWILINNLDKFRSFIQANNIAEKSNYSRLNTQNNSVSNVGNKLIKTSRTTSPPAPSPLTLQPDALYPTWLLSEPLPLAVLHGAPHYQGPLTLVAGPQRLETGWFDTPALRDYFIAQSAQAGLLWVFKERLGERLGGQSEGRSKAAVKVGFTVNPGAASGTWYLHGRFD